VAKRKKGERTEEQTAEILTLAKKQYERLCEKDAQNRANQAADIKFIWQQETQWTKEERAFRGKDPCMTFPQFKQFIAQVVNDQRQSRPGIRIHPADGAATKEVAEIYQGVVRGIEVGSQAEAVYDWGYLHAVAGGRGYWRIVSEYESPKSFNQKLVIKKIADPLSVRLSLDYTEPDGADRSHGFVEEVLTKDEFEAKYPDAKPLNWGSDNKWYPKDGEVIVADYYKRVLEMRALVELMDGSVVYDDELPPDAMIATDPDGKPIRRECEHYRVEWYTLAGGEQILATHEWPGSIIPVVCAMGDETVIDGDKVYQGLIAQAKDTQRLFNFGMSQQAIHLALTPRAPYVGPAAAFAGHKEWETANTETWSYLPYEHVDAEGKPIPGPTRSAPATPDSGWLNWTQQMQGMMKSIIGMYENTLGMRGGETSGKAITAREKQGDTATFHYLDNHARAISLTGRILVECIPTYYSTERQVQTVGQDGTAKMQKINEQQLNIDGEWRPAQDSDLTRGQYAVTVDSGPTYATKKQEAAELTMQLVQAYPPIMQWAGDLVIGLQEIPDVDLIVERMKLSLPPPVQEMMAAKDAGENPEVARMQAQMKQMAEQFQGQMQQMQQQMQQVAGENQQLKASTEASVAASNARVEQSRASVAAEETKGMVEQMKAMNERMKIQEESAAKRDELMIEALKVLVIEPQAAAMQPQATEVLQANP
jgi:hypothetical protein